MEADLDSEWDCADSHPRDPWVALAITMLGPILGLTIGVKTSQPCSTDFVQQIVGCKDGAHERCGVAMTTDGCS